MGSSELPDTSYYVSGMEQNNAMQMCLNSSAAAAAAVSTSIASSAITATQHNVLNTGGIQINKMFTASREPSIAKQSKAATVKKSKYHRHHSPYSSSSSEESKSKHKTKGTTSNGKKKTTQLLSDDQKRANHIASEQKRRANIRVGFEQLVDIVPTLTTGHRSEALILQKTVDHLRQLLDSKSQLKERARQLQLSLGEMPDQDSSEEEIDYDF